MYSTEKSSNKKQNVHTRHKYRSSETEVLRCLQLFPIPQDALRSDVGGDLSVVPDTILKSTFGLQWFTSPLEKLVQDAACRTSASSYNPQTASRCHLIGSFVPVTWKRDTEAPDVRSALARERQLGLA